MKPRVEIAHGTAFEVLISLAAVADADWRDVFTSGRSRYDGARRLLGRSFVDRVGLLGRFGWINLVGLVTASPRPWALSGLVAAAERAEAVDLHYLAIGGDRRQLLDLVTEPQIRAALDGDPAARRVLVEVFARDDHVLAVENWLLTTPSAAVQEEIVDLLQAWQQAICPPEAEQELTAVLAAHAETASRALAGTTGRDFLEQTIGGVHFDPAGLDRVLAVSSPAVTPIIVVVDGRDATVILHPPIEQPMADPATRLLELSRAVGDKTRIRLLTLLREGERSAVDLAHDLSAPRTTLLHHLAILRSAGVIHVSVTPGGATLYRLRPEGFRELSTSAADFISSR